MMKDDLSLLSLQSYIMQKSPSLEECTQIISKNEVAGFTAMAKLTHPVYKCQQPKWAAVYVPATLPVPYSPLLKLWKSSR